MHDLVTAAIWLAVAFALGVAAGVVYRPARGGRK